MAKKGFIIEKGDNLQGGIKNLLNVEPEPVKEEKAEKDEKEIVPKTYLVKKEDIEYIDRYVLYMGYKSKRKYTQAQCINDALNLLREKYPEA